MEKKILEKNTGEIKNVTAGLVFISDDYEIKRWAFDFLNDKKGSNGYNDCFCFTMVKEGNFLFDVAPGGTTCIPDTS